MFDKNEIAFTRISRTLTRTESGRANLIRTEWGLKGKIIRPNQAELFAALVLRQRALAFDGCSATMMDNNGGSTPFFLDNNDAIGGVRVSQPISHSEISGAHGTTFLRYEFGLMTESFSNPGGYLTFSETVSFDDLGGGPIQVERIPAQGEPILQTVSEQSWFFATQSGQLTQQGSGIAPMPPIWPNLLRRQPGSKVISPLAVKTLKGVPIEFGISWRYQFISTYPIVGVPNIRG